MKVTSPAVITSEPTINNDSKYLKIKQLTKKRQILNIKTFKMVIHRIFNRKKKHLSQTSEYPINIPIFTPKKLPHGKFI
jgi:actin-related protein